MKLMICMILCFRMEIAASQVIFEAGSVLASMVIKELMKMGTDFAKEQMIQKMEMGSMFAKPQMDSCVASGECKKKQSELIRDYIKDNIHFMCDDNATYLYQQLETLKLTKDFEEYDIAINPEGRTLKAIGNLGWNYVVNNPKRFKELAKDKGFKAFFVCVLGQFNQGKTWLINLLSERLFEFGFDQVTKSIGCALPVTRSQIVYCDSPGTSRAVHREDLNDRVRTDRIIEETMIHFSDMLLLVCGPLTTTEQLRHRKYIDRVSEISEREKRVVYIVHNWKNFYTHKQVRQFIKSDIIDAYGAEERNLNDHSFYFHIDNQTGLEIIHIVFAAEGSPAGMYWNNKSLQMLKNLIEDLGQTMARHTFQIVKEFKRELEPLLRETFTTRDAKEGTSSRNESYFDIYWNMAAAPVRIVTGSGKMLWSKIFGNIPWKESHLLNDIMSVKEFKRELEDAKEGTSSRNESYFDIYWNMLAAPVRIVTGSEKMLWSKIFGNIHWKESHLLNDIMSVFGANTQPSSDLDPYKLIIQNKTLVLKNAHNLEYFESSEIGGRPVPFYRAPFGIYVSNNTWEIQIQIAGCDWWNASEFSGILVRREANKLIVEGNILKPDRVKDQVDGEYVFDILTESRRFGYFRMPFELPACVNLERCKKKGKIGWYDEMDNPNCQWKKSLQSGTLIITAEAKGCKLPKTKA